MNHYTKKITINEIGQDISIDLIPWVNSYISNWWKVSEIWRNIPVELCAVYNFGLILWMLPMCKCKYRPRTGSQDVTLKQCWRSKCWSKTFSFFTTPTFLSDISCFKSLSIKKFAASHSFKFSTTITLRTIFHFRCVKSFREHNKIE